MTGYTDPSFAAKFGIVDIDWSNGMQDWSSAAPTMDCGGMLLEQAARQKAANPEQHVWIYRNLVKAESCFREIQEKLNDPAHDGWFLKHSNGSKVVMAHCNDHAAAWHLPPSVENRCYCGNVTCGSYLWDHRNASLRQWLADTYVGGATGVGNENVDGLYLDDGWPVVIL